MSVARLRPYFTLELERPTARSCSSVFSRKSAGSIDGTAACGKGTLARLLAAPIPRSAALAGKLLTSLSLGAVSMGVLALATHFLLGAHWGDPLGVAILIAAGVLDGRFRLWTFTDEAVNRPAIRALYPKIEYIDDPRCVSEDPQYETRSPGSRGFVVIEVRTKDGRSEQIRIDKPPGSPQRELSWDDLKQKFLDCAGHSGHVGPKSATAAFDAIRKLDQLNDIAQVTQPLLLFRSLQDHGVEPSNAEWILKHVSSSDRAEVLLHVIGQEEPVVEAGTPAHERLGVRGAPERGHQRTYEQVLEQAHARMRRHLESAQFHEAQPAAAAVRGIQLVDAELGPMRVARDVDQEMSKQAVDQPRLDMAA